MCEGGYFFFNSKARSAHTQGDRKKDTVNYTLCQNNKRAYAGVTFKDGGKNGRWSISVLNENQEGLCCLKANYLLINDLMLQLPFQQKRP